jgi:thioesterase domain-containing protein
MAAHYVQEVRRLQPSGPYYLAGASMGGKIAFEMAQQITEQGEPVDLLALIDTTADVERPALPLGERVQLHSTNVRRLGPRYLVHRARVRLRRWIYGWVIRMGWPLPRFMRNLKGISYIAAHNYHPRSYPGKVTLFRAAERPQGGTRDFFLGWDRVAGGGMEVYEIPGTHVSLMLEPGVRLLARGLQRCLDLGRGEGPLR